MRDGFEDDHVPVVTIPRTVRSGPIIVNTWSDKTCDPYVRVRGPLTLDAMRHFETDPSIEKMSVFPIKLPYDVSDRYGVIGRKSYCPQLGVQYRPRRGENRGRRVYMDIVPLEIQKKNPWMAHRTQVLKQAFRDELVAEYNVLDERNILIEPLISNVRLMTRHLRARDPKAVRRVREVLNDLDMPTTIGEVTDISALSSPWAESTDKDGELIFQRHLVEIDRARSAIIQLAVWGEIWIDLSEHIGPLTAIERNDEAGEFR